MYRATLLCLAMALAVPCWAQDAPAEVTPEQVKAEQRIYDTLRDVLNQGADLYNSGDQNGCYRLFEGAMKTVLLQLEHRPELKKTGEDALADAARQRTAGLRAFKLHDALEDIRVKIRPKKGPPVIVSDKTLWIRLGGDKNVTKIVDDFVDAMKDDKDLNFGRDGKVNLGEAQMAKLRRHIVAVFSEASGGKDKYEGKPLREVFDGLNVTPQDLDLVKAHLNAALKKNGVKQADTDDLLKNLEPVRVQILATMKPPEEIKDPPEKKDPPTDPPEKKDPPADPPEKKDPPPPPPPPA